ncbi:MAG: L,D-transpeptidase family protein [Candidatus Omnitrophota bacterium]
MERNRLLLITALCVTLFIVAVSFVVLGSVPAKPTEAVKLDKAQMIYERAEAFVKAGEYDQALKALFVIINKYPESEYAEKSLRQLASIYLEKGDYGKARYYYNRLLKDVPDIKDAARIQSQLEEINMKMMFSPEITADSVEYVVQPGDSLFAISRRFNTTVELIKKINALKSDLIRPGQKLKIVVAKFSIMVDKSRNTLLLEKDGEPLKTYTVSTGKDNSTPVGKSKIEEKMIKPLWYKVNAIVPADSDDYELGERWMGLSVEGYGIHGTSDETTIGRQITQGCVRMRNNDVVELFDIVPSGTEVEIVDSVKE